jgi:hypothetical protein
MLVNKDPPHVKRGWATFHVKKKQDKPRPPSMRGRGLCRYTEGHLLATQEQVDAYEVYLALRASCWQNKGT